MNNVVTVTVDTKNYIVSIFDGKGNLTLSNLISGNYSVNAIFAGDDKYSGSFDVKHIEVNKIPTDLSISLVNSSLFAGDSAVIDIVLNQSVNGIVTVNVNDKNYTAVIVHGKGNLTLNNLTPGNYSVNAVFAGDEKYLGSSSNNMIFGVDKLNTSLFADPITATYNINENLIITLKDSKGNAVSGVNVTVNLNGAKTLTTDNNGQIKVSTNDLTPNIYNAKITFNGSEIYDKSFAEVKVTVKKATPKIIASAKTFKLKTKTKKYSITLKDNINNVIKNARVILKIKGKTYQATTNSKGVATFKLKLNKKGTYTAVITYNGNNFYNKVSANAKIKVK
ncbi:MAG: Ig-like domain repeat protein [Methanobrevibacter thaueri]|nr:Ig-like domain repeat protein [Methanobrevibacter thaueri]